MSSRPHPETERALHAPLQSFRVDEEVARMRGDGEKEWKDGRRNVIPLCKGEGFSVALSAIRAGDRMAEYYAPGPTPVAVREDRIRFTTDEVEAGVETLISCDADVRHAVETLEKSVCLVSTAGRHGPER